MERTEKQRRKLLISQMRIQMLQDLNHDVIEEHKNGIAGLFTKNSPRFLYCFEVLLQFHLNLAGKRGKFRCQIVLFLLVLICLFLEIQ